MEVLKQWFGEMSRSLPWREKATPYRVWVSEVMLQQTQVAVVIPYFERFMDRFPTMQALAHASEEEVIKFWEGLGYYSRARNLHRGAQWVVEKHGGELPSDEASLLKIKGIGPYTQGAIRSFAFHLKAAAVDGNVSRVICRLFAIEEEVRVPKVAALVDGLLPDHDPWTVMEALIELGALVCGKIPKCQRCPLVDRCKAYQMGKERELPKKKNKVQYESLYRFVPVIRCGDHYLVRLEDEGKVMQGLWQFPYIEDAFGFSVEKKEVTIRKHLNLVCNFIEEMPSLKQSFTRFRATLFPSIWHSTSKSTVEGFSWKHHDELKQLSFCAGHRKIAALCVR